jgi:NAD(P)-dependent dehydrogenase (short-subunit alcohol dehydrogenase family)
VTLRHVIVIAPHGAVGSAVSRELKRRGSRVTGAGRTRPDAGIVDTFFPTNFSRTAWSELFASAAEGGSLDGVVYAAGAGVFGRTAAIPPEEARAAFDVNFWAMADAAHAAVERWVRDASPGCFLAILSIAGRRAVPFEAYYGASKAAAVRYLEALQLEVPESIRIVAACPGLIRTPFRSRATWHGMPEPPVSGGATPEETAASLCDLLEGSRQSRVIGWRERAIDLADRLLPGAYDRLVLRRRVAREIRP